MRNFACTACGNAVYFENSACLICGHALGFLASEQSIIALRLERTGRYQRVGGSRRTAAFAYCANHVHGVCNWIVPAGESSDLCIACDHNRTIPNLAEKGSIQAWGELERAKKRLVYSLLRFQLPLDCSRWGKGRMTFDFVRRAMTGHQDGVITVDIREADAVERERQRLKFDEPYRSLLGHLRHESGHFYWTVLVDGGPRLEQFRRVFGDERRDYGEALVAHHTNGAPADWQAKHLSAYASAHPWEDWAETWAHYIHMVDTLDTADATGMERPPGRVLGFLWRKKARDVYRPNPFHALMQRWIPLTLTLNSLTRSMGHADFYPFVIPVPAYEKLAFVHDIIHAEMPRLRRRKG